MTGNAIKAADLRYERKFVISALSKSEVEAIIRLHPAIFSEIYYQRYVNNIYFDTINLSSYNDHLDGISERMKVRIRWYGEVFGRIKEPVLELKIKRSFLGGKLRYPLEPFCLDGDYSSVIQRDLFEKADIPEALAEYLRHLKFTVLNHYTRKYFQSADRKFTFTLDSDMEYYRIDPANNSFTERIVDRNRTILELKYAQQYDEEARYITNHLPLTVVKSSKYITGIERIH